MSGEADKEKRKGERRVAGKQGTAGGTEGEKQRTGGGTEPSGENHQRGETKKRERLAEKIGEEITANKRWRERERERRRR